VIDRVIDPLEKAMMKNLAKEASVPADATGAAAAPSAPAGPEAERAYEQLRSSVRLINCVNTLPEIGMNRRWQEFIAKIMQKPSIVTMMNSGDV
jgi:hypothetical protein